MADKVTIMPDGGGVDSLCERCRYGKLVFVDGKEYYICYKRYIVVEPCSTCSDFDPALTVSDDRCPKCGEELEECTFGVGKACPNCDCPNCPLYDCCCEELDEEALVGEEYETMPDGGDPEDSVLLVLSALRRLLQDEVLCEHELELAPISELLPFENSRKPKKEV